MTETKTKRDVYEIVTARIIDQLEKGNVPWKQPWTNAGLPQNLISRKSYRGINLLLLASLHYSQNFFLTLKQVQELGGKVKKGEKACPIVFWNWKEDENIEEKKKIPILRYYSVFNVEQCEDIPADKIPVDNLDRPNNPIQACFDIVDNMPKKPAIKHKENRAYYYPFFDFINMPKMERFTDSESYYDTLFHELVHSTGHVTRLDRKEVVQMKSLGGEAYSIEELTAEVGACYLASVGGIVDVHFDNNVAYIQGWLEKLKSDKRFIIYACAKAQKAVDFILNVPQAESDEEKNAE